MNASSFRKALMIFAAFIVNQLIFYGFYCKLECDIHLMLHLTYKFLIIKFPLNSAIRFLVKIIFL